MVNAGQRRCRARWLALGRAGMLGYPETEKSTAGVWHVASEFATIEVNLTGVSKVLWKRRISIFSSLPSP